MKRQSYLCDISNEQTHTMDNTMLEDEAVIDGKSPSNKYVWIGDQYIPIESLI